MKLSVIIPVYNVENYLEKCVNSVINQTYNDLEILLINDGSTDSSGNVAEKLAKKDSRIKVFHKENGGLSDTRNYGINISEADYVTFLDSDDFIINDAYSTLMKPMKNNIDISLGNVVNYYFEDKQITRKTLNKPKKFCYNNGSEYLLHNLKNKSYTVVAVQGIYKKDLIIKNDLFFEKGLLHEDELWTPQILLAAKKMKYTDIDFYMHYQREGSITKQKDKTKNAFDIIKIGYILSERYEFITNNTLKKELKNRLVTNYLSAYSMAELYNNKSFKVDYNFLFKNVNNIRNLSKILILLLSKNLYKKIYKKHKKYKNR